MRVRSTRSSRSTAKVVAGPDGIAISRFWNGTLLLPWDLIRDIRVANIPGPGYLWVQVVLADGSARILPAPTAPAHTYDPKFHAALNALYEQRHLHRLRRAAEPEDTLPAVY